MTPVVLDTGVMVKVFVEEEESPKATNLLLAAAEGTYHLAAPDSMAIEFGNVLWKYVQRNVLREEEAWEALADFPFDRIEWLPARVLLPGAFRFAMDHGIAVYDAAFLAAATSLGTEFITTDHVLHRKVGGQLPWVKLLREFDVASASSEEPSRMP